MSQTFKPISPSELYMFTTCPRKLWYHKDRIIKPLLFRTNEYMELGLNVHTIIAHYYKKLQKKELFTPDEIHATFQMSVSEKRGIIDDIRKYTHHFKKFERFEHGRLQWSHFKPLEVEQYHKNKNYRGIVDVVYRDNQEEKVPVDWKTGRFKDWHLMQGCIYKDLTQSKRMMFFSTLSDQIVEFTNEQFEEGENQIEKIMNQLDNGVKDKRKLVQCRECEYSIHCRLSELNLKEI